MGLMPWNYPGHISLCLSLSVGLTLPFNISLVVLSKTRKYEISKS